MKYQSIAKEAALCRKACKNSKVGDVMVFLHHEVAAEVLREPVENRIKYILSVKPKVEQAVRLHWLRPCPFKLPEKWLKARAELSKAAAEWSKADAEWLKADAELSKARAEWLKAAAEWSKADAECKKEIDTQIKYCLPDCPWDGTTLFPESPHAKP